MKNEPQNPLSSTFFQGIEEMKNGLAKVKSVEKIYENDSWMWDWVTVLQERIKVLETAGKFELE